MNEYYYLFCSDKFNQRQIYYNLLVQEWQICFIVKIKYLRKNPSISHAVHNVKAYKAQR